MNTPTSTERPAGRPINAATFRWVTLLVGGYVALSAGTLLAIVLLRNDSAVVNDAVWVRGGIVVVSALLTLVFAVQTSRGSGRAFLRLRIITAVMVVAIVVIIALPGIFPLWMKLEQGTCGALLLGVVLLVNRKRLRTLFGVR